MTSATSHPAPDEDLLEILGTMEADILNIVGEEFAPKQEHGSPERKQLLGLLTETYKVKAEALNKVKALLYHSQQTAVQGALDAIEAALPKPEVIVTGYEHTDHMAYKRGHNAVLDQVTEVLRRMRKEEK